MAAFVGELRAAGLPLRRHVVLPLFEAEPEGALLIDGSRIPETELRDLIAAGFESRQMSPDDMFMLNSTSGTTGMSKCVMHTQNRWMYFHQVAAEHRSLTADDDFFGAVPAPFGFGLWTAHVTPNLLGAPTVVRERFSADGTLAAVQAHGVTVMCCVSTQFIMMLNSAQLADHDLRTLRAMFTGEEAVPYERARELKRRPARMSCNSSGPTRDRAFQWHTPR